MTPIEKRNRERQQHRGEHRHALLDLDQGDGPGPRHDRDLAEIDAAADHDQAHAEAENAEDGNAAQQVQQVRHRGEAVERQPEHDQQRDGDQEHDLLLVRLGEVQANGAASVAATGD